MTKPERHHADVFVIGGGPAGSTFASRMAQLGHQVWLVERAQFPRRHLGESLSPGVLPLLETIGARDVALAADVRSVSTVQVDWDQGPQDRHDPRAEGLLVERGDFDRRLLDHARSLGVRVIQPASVRPREAAGDGWHLALAGGGRTVELRASFLADATGRASGLSARRRQTAHRTFALYAYWRGERLPDQPRIEAGADAWYWGVPIPDGTYNTLVFLDARQLRSRSGASLEGRFRELLGRSGLMAGCSGARLVTRVRAADATPYLDESCVSARSIKVGDAAIALDPLSSSGVQKAIQTSLAGALVANTLLRKPEYTEPALQFYRQSLSDASNRHCRWAASYYGAVARSRGGAFWHERAADGLPPPDPRPRHPVDERLLSEARLEPSSELEIVDQPCLVGDFVDVRSALRHPALEGPVAFLGGLEIAPLIAQLRPGMTPLQLARVWSSRVPLRTGMAIAAWLLAHGILVRQPGERRDPLQLR